MRVIAGLYRSRPLVAPRGLGTRPTSDRLRETLFNVLSPFVAGASFADLYSGTGAVGIEALSRGAAHVFFAETGRPALQALRQNLQQLGVRAGYSLEDRGTAALLTRLAGQPPPQPLDLVFLDPPYEAAAEYTATLGFLGSARATPLLSAHARIVAEHGRKAELPERFGHLLRTRTLLQGDAALSFYSLDLTSPELSGELA